MAQGLESVVAAVRLIDEAVQEILRLEALQPEAQRPLKVRLAEQPDGSDERRALAAIEELESTTP